MILCCRNVKGEDVGGRGTRITTAFCHSSVVCKNKKMLFYLYWRGHDENETMVFRFVDIFFRDFIWM